LISRVTTWLPSARCDRQALMLVLVHLRRNETFAELAPDLRQALRIAARKAYVILDGMLAPRASPALPGSTHDLAAARVHGIVDGLTCRAIACYADKAYVGAGGAIGTPYKRRKGRKLGKRKKLFNRHHAKVRALGERGAATLKAGTSCARPAAHQAD
jgi:hypothetical protein